MPNWTPERSTILYLLLDEVVGTEEMVHIRQDYCRIYDCFRSCVMDTSVHYTGSQSEGLDLPGSDHDFMYDVNDFENIKVTQTREDRADSSTQTVLLLCTENTPPGFAMLKYNSKLANPKLLKATQLENGSPCLSSSLYVRSNLPLAMPPRGRCVIQGPSIEYWNIYDNMSKSGVDHVFSIHCPFWPRTAEEWIKRPRHVGWPRSRDINTIVDFGCHLVPVGFPLSSSKDKEWRISFSVAERTLVWSFNHVQMQCYAIMKIILKEFIKVRCNSRNRILCSYFIKTFLFWKFETVATTFWRSDNLRECLNCLIAEFSQCIREGVLRHYFFPRFNLLSIKLDGEAQAELLQILEIAMQSDMIILKKCKTLHDTFILFQTTHYNIDTLKNKVKKMSLAMQDECNMISADRFHFTISQEFKKKASVPRSIRKFLTRLLTMQFKTSLVSHVLKYYFSQLQFQSTPCSGNRYLYKLHNVANSRMSSFDISTCKLQFALALLQNEDYSSCLKTVNDVLSRIPPYAMYISWNWYHSNIDARVLSCIKYFESNTTILKRLKSAWLFDLYFHKNQTENLPLAIQIELNHCDDILGVSISPFTCAYYLTFLCYHKLKQIENRDRALSMLVDVVGNNMQCGRWKNISYNITGHCLMLVGHRNRAREMFIRSLQCTQRHVWNRNNSAPALLKEHSGMKIETIYQLYICE